MPRFRTILTTAGAGLAATALTALAAASPAAAAAPGSLTVTTDGVAAAAGWLTTQFVGANHLPSPSGNHFDSKYGSDYYPNYGENADVVFGLVAAQAGGAKIATALDYLAANADAYADLSGTAGGPYDGSVAKLAVAAMVAGRDPASFAGHDLLATLKKDECDGSTASCPAGSAANIYASISESFVVVAEARAGGAFAPSGQALAYLLSLQCSASGGFTADVKACAPGDEDIDATSYAIMALTAAGGHSAELAHAVSWLESKRAAGGYWVSQGAPNTNSTGLAAAALAGTGADVSASRAWLRTQQVAAGKPGAGALRYAGSVAPTTSAATSPSVLATAQGLDGLVDGGSLATLSAHGVTPGAAVFAPATTLSSATLRAGSSVAITTHGFAAGEKVEASVRSASAVLATRKTDALGSVTASVTLPASVSAGTQTVELRGLTSGLVTDSPVTVAAASATGPSNASGGTTSTTQPLAATGQDSRRLVDLAALGALAMVAGLGLTLLGRVRRHA